MQTVPEISLTRKPAKAFYCTFHGLSGVLTCYRLRENV